MADTRQARSHTGGRIAVGIVLSVISLFCFLSIVGSFGGVGRAVYGFWVGFFGLAAYAYTIIGVILGIAITFGIRPRMRFLRALLYIGMVAAAILALQVYTSSGHIIGANYGGYLRACYDNTNTAGGMLFGLVTFPVMKAITSVGALVVMCAIFFVLVFIALFPSIRRNVTYTAPVRRVRRTSPETKKAKPETDRPKRAPKKQNTVHYVNPADIPAITDLSQTQQGTLYVVDVDADPMPKKRNRKAKGADGYKPLASFSPLYPNRDGGYEDEVLTPPRQSASEYASMNVEDLAKDILFGQNPSEEIIERYNTASNARANAFKNITPSYNLARRSEMISRLGIDDPHNAVREKYMARYRAQQEQSEVDRTAQSPVHLQEGQIIDSISQQSGIQNETPVKHDFYSLQQEQLKLYSSGLHAGQPREVVGPSRDFGDADAINSTIRKANDAVSGEVNVGVLGALNRAMAGETQKKTAEKEEMIAEAYEYPQLHVQQSEPQQPIPYQSAVCQNEVEQSAPALQNNQTVQQPYQQPVQAAPQQNVKQQNVPPIVSARPQPVNEENSVAVIKNGQPTTVTEVEKAGYTRVQDSRNDFRTFDAQPAENTSAQKPLPQRQMPSYELGKPSLDNLRPAYVDTNPTQGGAVPSEPAPIRQQVTGGQMSRAAIQGTTDIAGQSGKDKERAEILARIENITQTIKENPNTGDYDSEKMREAKVRSSQNRGLNTDHTKKNGADDRKTSGVSPSQITIEETIEKAKPKPRRPYTPPPVSLLNPPAADIDQGDDYEQRRELILNTLSQFNITGEVLEVQIGPTFTLYKLRVELPRGKTINYISSLENDIAMKIEAESVRIIAPIPGQNAVGIEVPNKHRRTVNLSEIIESPEFNRTTKTTSFALGKDIENKSCIAAVDELPHMLVAGATGAGKSCGINSLIVSLLYKASPDDVRFIMVDPKRVELSVYAGIPHLLMDEIICDADKAIRALTWAEQEMRRRMVVFGEVGCRNIDTYNANIDTEKQEKMPRIIIVVDEFADLMSVGGKTVESSVNAIARLARAVGIHLVLATQRPSTDVISGTIKNNFPSRVAFKVTTSFDSKTILDSIGAEKLLGRGDMLFMTAGKCNKRIQGAFISEEEVKRVVDYVKDHNDSYFDDNAKDAIFNEPEAEKSDVGKKGSKSKEGDESDTSDIFFKALEIGIEMREAKKSFSISYVQRRLGVGFNKAAKFVDRATEMGYVSTDEKDPKFKYVNLSYDEIDELKKNARCDGEGEECI